MDEVAVHAEALVKRYGGGLVAVDRLDLRIERGEIYGLLGPNGAGKSTTLRMLLGLAQPTSGTVSVLGWPPAHPAGLSRIGSMIESPAFYPTLSGRDNLRVAARRAKVSNRRVDQVLEQVALGRRSRNAFRTYSLGMKQRLGVAAALLKDPELLILDEPSNGLDPVGQLEMRQLIENLGGGGRTIILSSHDLDEVQRLCGRVGVIGGGRMLAEGPVGDLRGEVCLLVRAEPSGRAVQVASQVAGVAAVELSRGMLRLRLAEPGHRQAATITRELVTAGLQVSEVRNHQRSLEEAFLDLTGGRTGGADSIRGSRTLTNEPEIRPATPLATRDRG